MPSNANGRWFQAVLFLVGLIVGGGAASAIGHAQYSALEQRVTDVENRILDRMTNIDRRLSRIEGKLQQ